MSPSMAMEMNSKVNVTNYQSMPNRHHVRNLWPPVGGGLPGGKPIEPALGSSSQILQKPLDYYSQSTSNTQNKPVPRSTDISSNVNDFNYYESSQNSTNPMATTNVIPTLSEYSQYYSQQPKYFQYPGPTSNNSYPPPSPQMQTTQLYHPDPTAMFNQAS